MTQISAELTPQELELLISSLLFSSSVNVVSNTQEAYQKQLIELAIKLKQSLPDIQLNHIQFIEEEDYEDQWSSDILEHFKENLETINFDKI